MPTSRSSECYRSSDRTPFRIISLIIFLIAFINLALLFADSDEYVLVISFDGFRYDYLEKTETPNFDKFISNGVNAKSLIPVFPSLTFPNHYSIATGAYSDRHRILSNSFFSKTLNKKYSMRNSESVQNGDFYGMEPIWVTAEKKGLNTATYFWIGSEAEINGYRPSIYKNYDGSVSFQSRVDSIITWFEYSDKKKPQLSMLYFSEPDYSGHRYGTKGSEIITSIKEMDDLLGYVINRLETLDIYNKLNIIIVSDHGMTDVDKDRVVLLDKYIDLNQFDLILGPSVSSLNFKINKDNIRIDRTVEHLSIFYKENIPIEYHFKNQDAPDYLLVADEGWFISTTSEMKNKKNFPSGMHGYNSKNMSMHGIFIASGPSFNKGVSVDSFENINVYPIICKVLNIDPYDNGNGKYWNQLAINQIMK